jgi:hypothetical protein
MLLSSSFPLDFRTNPHVYRKLSIEFASVQTTESPLLPAVGDVTVDVHAYWLKATLALRGDSGNLRSFT